MMAWLCGRVSKRELGYCTRLLGVCERKNEVWGERGTTCGATR